MNQLPIREALNLYSYLLLPYEALNYENYFKIQSKETQLINNLK